MHMRSMVGTGIALASLLMLAAAAPASVSDDQVTSQKIREADGTSGQNTNDGSGVKTNHIQNAAVTASKIADGAVTSGKIAAGAVTDASITGPISASKISSTGLNADTVDGVHAAELAAAAHDHDALYQRHYANVVVVAKSGGDFTDPISRSTPLSTQQLRTHIS